jgi:hypothetical protein
MSREKKQENIQKDETSKNEHKDETSEKQSRHDRLMTISVE